jgi:hypothetical protein
VGKDLMMANLGMDKNQPSAISVVSSAGAVGSSGALFSMNTMA